MTPSSTLYISEVISIEQIKKLVLGILHTYPDVHCVLFGSYAKHCPGKASDIDLLLLFDKSKRDYHFLKVLSEKIQEAFAGIGKYCKPIYGYINTINNDNAILLRQYLHYGLTLQQSNVHFELNDEDEEVLQNLEYTNYWTPMWQEKLKSLEVLEKEGLCFDGTICRQYLFLLLYWYAKAYLTLQRRQHSLNSYTLVQIYSELIKVNLSIQEYKVLKSTQMMRDNYVLGYEIDDNKEDFSEDFAVVRAILDRISGSEKEARGE